MANKLFSTKVPCDACLNMDKNVYPYSITNEIFLKAAQTLDLTLCYICRLVAIRTEAFLENVSKIHTLKNASVDNNIAFTDATANANIKNVIKLDKSDMQITMESGIDNDNSMLETFLIISDHKQVENVKPELLIFDDNYDLKDEYEDCDISSPLHTKHECDDLGTEQGISETEMHMKIEQTEVDIERSALVGSKVKRKNKKIKNVTEPGSHYKLIYLTKEQCMEDRQKMSEDKRYKNSPYKCEDCLKAYTHRDSYDKHMVSHEEESGSYSCDICKQRRKTSELLTKHRALHFRKYKCTQCHYTKLTRISIKEHYNAVHSAKVIYSCNMCVRTYWKKTLLKKHIAYHHSDAARVNCEFCGKSYANHYVLKTHLNTVHADKTSAPPPKREQVCATCGAAFRNGSQLRAHAATHSDARLCYCVECDKSFKSESILKQHLRFAAPHVNHDFLPYACEDPACGKRFASARSRAAHNERVHLQRRTHRCADCDKAYFSSYVLAGHRKSAHGNQERLKKYPCTMCDKVFNRMHVLKDHIRTHTGERPYECKQCASAFTQSSVLWRHVKTIHMKTKTKTKGVAVVE